MKTKKKICLPEVLLMASGAAFILMTTPAWPSGMAFAVLSAVIFCLALLRLSPGGDAIRSLLRSQTVWCAGLLTASAFGCNFYNTWLDSSYVLKIAGFLHLKPELFLAICSVGIVLVSTPAVTCLLQGAFSLAKADYTRTKQKTAAAGKLTFSAGKSVIVLFLMYLVGFSAVLRANFYYLDDNGRAAFGYKTWDYFGRYISTAFSTLLHMGDYLVDITPLPQLLALLLMAVCGVMVLYILYDRTDYSLWELAAVVPLGLNPYFLECLSFRFDAPYMAVSVLAGVFPLLYRKEKNWVYLLMSMLGILGVCTSYQASTGIFPMLVIVVALRMWNSGTSFRDTLTFCLRSAAGYLLGLVYFKCVIMKPADAGYVANSLPEGANLVSKTLQNYTNYVSLILTDFKPFWLLLAALTVLSFVYLTVRDSGKKLPALLMSAAALAMMGLLCFGLYPFLEATLFSPRAMYGFGVLLTLLFAVTAEGPRDVPLKMPALVLSWVFFVFSLTYGNALSLQKNYTEFRVHMVMEDLNDLEVFQREDTVYVCLAGDIGKTPIMDNMPKDSRILDRLVPHTLAAGDDLTEYQFFGYYGFPDSVRHGSPGECTRDMPVLKEGLFQTIRGEGNRILIELK